MTAEPRIVDLVFEGHEKRRRLRLAGAVGVGLLAHLVLVAWGLATQPSLETWSAELATRVHAELTREDVIELPKSPPPVEKPKEAPPPPVAEAPRAPRPHTHLADPPRAPSPAQAGRIVAADPNAPVDLPGESFVAGTAKTYAGGVTASTGKSTTAVTGPIAPDGPAAKPGAAPAEKDRSAEVALDSTDWSCPWPREADAESIDEQSVILQVVVRPDGTAESVKALSDPGHGFAQAARACALATRFSPARDRLGHAVRAESPPIRIHFTR